MYYFLHIFYGSREIPPGNFPPWKFSPINPSPLVNPPGSVHPFSPGQQFLVSSEQLVVFLWNFGNVKKIFLETFCMHKFPFHNNSYKLLSKFHTEKNWFFTVFQLPDMTWSLNLNWGYPLAKTSIGNVINLIIWLYLENLSGP